MPDATDSSQKADWIARVLGVALAAYANAPVAPKDPSPSAKRVAEALAISAGSVGRAKLSLRIRAAHAKLLQDIREIADKVRPDARASLLPVEEEALRLLNALPDLVPDLDPVLEKALESYDSAQDEAGRAEAGRLALASLERFGGQLGGSDELAAIDVLAHQAQLGQRPGEAMQATLVDIAGDIRA